MMIVLPNYPTNTVSLDDVLAYRHPGVVRRYAKDHGATPEEAEEIFRETLKWLYLGYRGMTDASATCAMTSDIEKLDWMWHTFILFTIDYAKFCDLYFGFFLHHRPEDAGDDEPETDAEEFQAQLEGQYALVCDVLGEETLTEWYDECRYAAASAN